MTHEDISLPPAVRTVVTLLLETVARGLRRCVWQFGAPADAWRSNVCVLAGVGYALVQMRRLHRILRYVFVILATRFAGLKPARPKPAGTAPPAAPKSCRPALADAPATWRTSFVTSTAYHPVFDPDRVAPSPFTSTPRNLLRTLARKMEGLRRALADPMRHVRRLARILRGCVAFFRWRPPKRRPPLARRAHWEELLMGLEQARFELRRFNTS